MKFWEPLVGLWIILFYIINIFKNKEGYAYTKAEIMS